MDHSTTDSEQKKDSCTHSQDTTTDGSAREWKQEREQRQEGATGLPSLHIATPHPFHVISTRFAAGLRNMFIPFPDHIWEPVQARFIADARNAAVYNAMENGFDLHMQIDADQWVNWDTFLELYEGIKLYGEDTIVTAWSICKSGMFEKQPSVYDIDEGGVGINAIPAVELQTGPRFREVSAFGTACFLAPVGVFKKISSPWFADINAIFPSERVDGVYVATQFTVGQDLYASNRFKQAGVKIVCATRARLPHETVSYL